MGAKVLFLEDTGILKEGYRADLIGLNCNRPHMIPMHDPLAQVVYSAAAADVSLVMVDGKYCWKMAN
jgi:5-methylthioadenosine/S-adenosylhomocysteine deaminase